MKLDPNPITRNTNTAGWHIGCAGGPPPEAVSKAVSKEDTEPATASAWEFSIENIPIDKDQAISLKNVIANQKWCLEPYGENRLVQFFYEQLLKIRQFQEHSPEAAAKLKKDLTALCGVLRDFPNSRRLMVQNITEAYVNKSDTISLAMHFSDQLSLRSLTITDTEFDELFAPYEGKVQDSPPSVNHSNLTHLMRSYLGPDIKYRFSGGICCGGTITWMEHLCLGGQQTTFFKNYKRIQSLTDDQLEEIAKKDLADNLIEKWIQPLALAQAFKNSGSYPKTIGNLTQVAALCLISEVSKVAGTIFQHLRADEGILLTNLDHMVGIYHCSDGIYFFNISDPRGSRLVETKEQLAVFLYRSLLRRRIDGNLYTGYGLQALVYRRLPADDSTAKLSIEEALDQLPWTSPKSEGSYLSTPLDIAILTRNIKALKWVAETARHFLSMKVPTRKDRGTGITQGLGLFIRLHWQEGLRFYLTQVKVESAELKKATIFAAGCSAGCLEILLDHNKDKDWHQFQSSPSEDSDRGFSLLSEAIESQNLDSVRLLLDRGHPVGLTEPSSGMTNAHLAIDCENIAILRMLIEQLGNEVEAFLSHPDADGLCPLMYALIRGHLLAAEIILHKKTTGFDREDSLGNSLLKYMASFGNKVLLAKLPRAVFQQFHTRNFKIMFESTMTHQNLETTRSLIENIPVVDLDPNTFHYIASISLISSPEILEAIINYLGGAPSQVAAANGDINALNAALAEPNTAINERLPSPFQIAAALGHTEALETLHKLKRWKEVKAFVSGIHLASRTGKADSLKYIIQNLPDSGFEGQWDEAPKGYEPILINAIMADQWECFEVLLQEITDDNEQWKGKSTLHYAAEMRDSRFIEALLDRDDSGINAFSTEGLSYENMTPLMLACREGRHLNALLLLEKGADPNIKQPAPFLKQAVDFMERLDLDLENRLTRSAWSS